MSKKSIYQKENGERVEKTLFTASRLEGKVKNTGIKNIRKKGKKKN